MPYRTGVMGHPLGELPSVVGEELELVRSQKVQWGEEASCATNCSHSLAVESHIMKTVLT